MPEAVTTLVEHKPITKQRRDGSGEFTIHVFKDDRGAEFQTLKSEIANQTYALVGKGLARLVFDVDQRGNFKNNNLSFAEPAAMGAEATDTSSLKYSGGGGGGGFRGGNPKNQRAINVSAGFARAIEMHAAGLVQLDSFDAVEKLAVRIADAIEKNSGGSAPAAAPTVAQAPPAPTAAPAAPSAPEPAAPAAAPEAPTDDIPF